MGYESKLLLCTSTGMAWGDSGAFAQVIASVDLSKAGYDMPVSTFIGASIKAEKDRIAAGGRRYGAYVIGGGDGFETEDCYSDPLAPLDLDGLIAAILADEVEYRRFALALYVLRGWRECLPMFNGKTEHAVVLHYGY